MSDGAKLNGTTADCASFQDELPGLFESGAELTSQPHLQTCENCKALVRDLKYIADQAKLLLPLHDPSPRVWDKIQNAIGQNAIERDVLEQHAIERDAIEEETPRAE